MKNIIKIAVVLLLVTKLSTGYAQDIHRGTFEVSGDFDISTLNTRAEGQTGNDLNLDFSGLYYLVDNLGVGLNLSMDNSSFGSGVQAEKSNSFGAGPLLSYNISTGARTSLKIRGGVLLSNIDMESFGQRTNGKALLWSVGGEMSYFITSNVSINSGLDYVSTTINFRDRDADLKITGISTTIGLSIYF